jgi:hypothetical protein
MPPVIEPVTVGPVTLPTGPAVGTASVRPAPPINPGPPVELSAPVKPAPSVQPSVPVNPSPAVNPGPPVQPSMPVNPGPAVNPGPPVIPGPVVTPPPVILPALPVPAGPPISAIPVTSLPPGVPYYSTPVYGAPYGQALPPGYPYPPAYGYPFVPAPPQPRQPAWMRWAIFGVVLLVIGVMSAGGGVLAGALTAADQTSTWHSAAGLPNLSAPPAANAPQTEWSSWARRTARDEIAAQSKALLAGDETGYIALADPSNATLVGTLKMRFADLHAMGLGAWQETLQELRPNGDKIWTADLTIDYCFGESTCSQAEITESTRWSVADGRLVLSKLDPAGADDNGPRPWETDTLTVRTGKRVVVSATKSNVWRLDDAVKVADQAAAISDTFAKWEPAPSRYVIFFAGPNDWKRWYGMDEPDWAAAWSVPVARSVTEIVVRSDVVAQSDLPVLLTHEMTHVTTLAGPRYGATVTNWWLIEGIAEYASHLNVALRDYDGVDATRQYVRSSWDGDPAVKAPGQDASQIEAGGKYGVAFLSVRRIADKYGKDKMLDFWGRVIHSADTLDAAARGALGVSWNTVKADCARYVRDQVAAL